MFTSLTIAAAWFSFGYCVTDIITSIAKNSAVRKCLKEDNLYRNSGHHGSEN